MQLRLHSESAKKPESDKAATRCYMDDKAFESAAFSALSKAVYTRQFRLVVTSRIDK